MSDSVGKGLIGFCLVGYGWLLRHFLGWNWWAAFALALAGAFVTGFCAYAIRDTWPLEVPCDLIDRVDGIHSGTVRVDLPGRQFVALRVTRV